MAKINKLSLTMSEINDLQEAYNIIDVSRDGSISVDELQKFFLLEGDISREEALAAVSYYFFNEFQCKVQNLIQIFYLRKIGKSF